MFNEAFWFFYWVGVVGNLDMALFIFAFIAAIGTGLSFPLYYIEDIKAAKKWHVLGPIIVAMLVLMNVFLPSENALYAGAGQYVAESAELDETLLKLKDAIDQKIDELSGKDNE